MDGDASTNPVQSGEYVVVARRYRPQLFGDLIGQGMVAQALKNAITTDRVGHAYLFTGARGVGKTSTARILAKALNCAKGPTTEPCGECDICLQVANGDDVDVLEIDGASNRGIDEIRQLRSNVGIRPSRSRFKVYIIDEVHMLTKEAFNALLKTLEEPPEHVKFIFCTTEPGKIPITVLSRCQRFDFSPVDTEDIARRLAHIVENEGATADAEALELLARRAAGSMRDSQSLLEQLLSFVGNKISVDDVHSMFGTAKADRVTALLQQLIDRNAAGVLAELQATLNQGVDAGQLAEQLVTCVRDVMASAVGCDPNLLLFHSPSDAGQLRDFGQQWGIETLLAALQILDQTVTRMRQSMHGRILLEIALVRIANLEDLDLLSQMAAQVSAGQPIRVERPAKKKLSEPIAKPAIVREDSAKTVASVAPAESVPSLQEELAPVKDEPEKDPIHTATKLESAPAERIAVEPTPVEPAIAESADPGLTSTVTELAIGNGAAETESADTDSVAELTPVEPAEDKVEIDNALVSDSARARTAQRSPVDDSTAPDTAESQTAESQTAMKPDDAVQAESVPFIELKAEDVKRIWQASLRLLGDMTSDFAANASDTAISGPNRLVVKFLGRYNTSKAYCERPEKRLALEKAIEKVTGKAVRLEFSVTRDDLPHATPPKSSVTNHQLKRQIASHPMVELAVKLFEAQVVKVEPGKKS